MKVFTIYKLSIYLQEYWVIVSHLIIKITLSLLIGKNLQSSLILEKII